jgi:hypothetical protein
MSGINLTVLESENKPEIRQKEGGMKTVNCGSSSVNGYLGKLFLKQPAIECEDTLTRLVTEFMHNNKGAPPPLPSLLEFMRMDKGIERLHSYELQSIRRKVRLSGKTIDEIISVSRKEVELNAIGPLYARLCENLWDKATVTAQCQTVNIVIDGYNEDPRELCDIPEARTYILTLDRYFPYLFFFGEIQEKNLRHGFVPFWHSILICLLRGTENNNLLRQELFNDFWKRHFGAMNEVFEHFGLDAVDKDWNARMSRRIIDYIKNSVMAA